MKIAKVKDHPTLERDLNTGAIICNGSKDSFRVQRKTQEQFEKRISKIEKTQEKIVSMLERLLDGD